MVFIVAVALSYGPWASHGGLNKTQQIQQGHESEPRPCSVKGPPMRPVHNIIQCTAPVSVQHTVDSTGRAYCTAANIAHCTEGA